MVSIDLRKDAIDVQKMLKKAVRKYVMKHLGERAAKKYPPVTRIDLTFSLGDSESIPWLNLNIDTKPGSEPDGDPTHPDFAALFRTGWLPAAIAVCHEKEVKVIGTEGKAILCDDAKLTETIGKFLVECLLAARKEGLFADLPKNQRCELGVEDPTTGEFGWPAYENRGKKNLVT